MKESNEAANLEATRHTSTAQILKRIPKNQEQGDQNNDSGIKNKQLSTDETGRHLWTRKEGPVNIQVPHFQQTGDATAPTCSLVHDVRAPPQSHPHYPSNPSYPRPSQPVRDGAGACKRWEFAGGGDRSTSGPRLVDLASNETWKDGRPVLDMQVLSTSTMMPLRRAYEWPCAHRAKLHYAPMPGRKPYAQFCCGRQTTDVVHSTTSTELGELVSYMSASGPSIKPLDPTLGPLRSGSNRISRAGSEHDTSSIMRSLSSTPTKQRNVCGDTGKGNSSDNNYQ
ncbi:hypothetical protein V493_01819 [Pseudogymnoascus sp. VKM F-4281 (FW-2241)]|nr:hypothetical protein V493_01819 [Pseudogymnoascus sp. VKM F-4281 (FW-2241)]